MEVAAKIVALGTAAAETSSGARTPLAKYVLRCMLSSKDEEILLRGRIVLCRRKRQRAMVSVQVASCTPSRFTRQSRSRSLGIASARFAAHVVVLFQLHSGAPSLCSHTQAGIDTGQWSR